MVVLRSTTGLDGVELFEEVLAGYDDLHTGSLRDWGGGGDGGCVDFRGDIGIHVKTGHLIFLWKRCFCRVIGRDATIHHGGWGL